MARYRVEKLSFIGGQNAQPGSEVEYDGIPGRYLTPLDDEAKAAKAAASSKPPGRAAAPPVALDLNPERKALVEIPADWRDLDGKSRVMLARKLGAPVAGTTSEAAEKFIETELARRATV